MDKTPEIKKFLDYTIEIVPDYDLIKIATLFYIFRRQYIEGFKNESHWKKGGDDCPKEFAIACYMLGCTLGYEHTYDCLYDELPLAIFKPKSQITIQAKEETKKDANQKEQKTKSTMKKDNKKTSKTKKTGKLDNGELLLNFNA